MSEHYDDTFTDEEWGQIQEIACGLHRQSERIRGSIRPQVIQKEDHSDFWWTAVAVQRLAMARIKELEAKLAIADEAWRDWMGLAESAHAKIAVAERDARRYRWVRRFGNNTSPVIYAPCKLLAGEHHLDQAIDAAIDAESGM